VDVLPKKKTTPREKIAQLVRLLGTTARGERVSAWRALERTMESVGVTWSDVGNWIDGKADSEGKYTEAEMQEFCLIVRKEGVEEGIKIGMTRVQTQQQSNGHVVLPEPAEMADFCHQRQSRLKNDWQRDFINDIYAITRRSRNLSLPRLGNLAKIYIEIGGRI
jgi:hypothetical protein